MEKLDGIFENTKTFEYLRDRFDPAYNDIIRAIDIVKRFITDNGLIIYGGTGMDYALRLKGDKIYDDQALAMPDLDFYSPTNVEHSYQLADILYTKGFKNVRVIRAMYVRTMRVDITDGHYIADITFCPKVVFEKLPTLEYSKMKIIHPNYQRIDLHSSMSFPYDDPPKEVIFARWSKDIKRWNLMNKHYPMVGGPTLSVKELAVPIDIHRYTLTGFAAYDIIHAHWLDLIETLKLKRPPALDQNIPPAKIDSSGLLLHFHTFDRMLDIVHFDIERAAIELKLSGANKYEAYFGAVYENIVGVMGEISVKIHSTKNRLITVNNVKIGAVNFKVVNVQALLRHFIAYANISDGKLRNTYVSYYLNLLDMIRFIEEKLTDKSFGVVSSEVINELKQSPLFPSVYTYGNANNSLAYLVNINMLLVDLGKSKPMDLPWNYYPDRSIPEGRPHPQFDPEGSEFFREEGRLVHKNMELAFDNSAMDNDKETAPIKDET